MSPNSKVWIYQSSREFSAEEAAEIAVELERFISQWAAHGQKLMANAEIFHNRFIVMCVDEKVAMASGCSIDDSTRFIKSLERKYNTGFFDRLTIAYKTGDDRVKTIHKSKIKEAVRSGELTPETPVFNNLVATKEEFEKSWIIPLRESWVTVSP